jgi:hypothetical protein
MPATVQRNCRFNAQGNGSCFHGKLAQITGSRPEQLNALPRLAARNASTQTRRAHLLFVVVEGRENNGLRRRCYGKEGQSIYANRHQGNVMKKNKFRFTNRALSQLPAHEAGSPSRSAEYSDADVIGLRVLVNKQGRKYFYFRFVFNGQKRAAKLGEFPALDVAGARTLALEMRAKVDRGINPQQSDSSPSSSLTFEAFGKDEYMPFARQTKRSAHDDECRLRVQIYPQFGTRKMSEIQTREIQQFHADMKESHCAATANRHLSLISRMYKLAVQWGRVERNPCIGISKFKENNQRQRFLTPEEIQRMYKAMESELNKTAVAALKFLLLTGARREEALKARWENVDLENGVWFLPQTKSGRGRYVQLNSEAQTLLKALPRSDGSPWLFRRSAIQTSRSTAHGTRLIAC